MRIGVITIEAGTNYGGILQCYAFQKVLKDMGHKVEFLRVKPAPVSRLMLLRARLAVATWMDIKQLFLRKSITEIPEEKAELTAVFDAFRERYFQMSPILDKDEVGVYANAHYDTIIVGSDQVWTWLFNPSNSTFVGWTPEFKGRRLSYASCSAYSNIRDWRRKKEIASFLAKFSYISVRDVTTQTLIRKITGKQVDIVPDPSELYDYHEFHSEQRWFNGSYIFAYILGSEIEGGHRLAIQKMRAQFGSIPVIAVKIGSPVCGINSIADQRPNNLTPQQWVSMLANATAVYTDSFHAVLFSLKFGVPFVAYYKDAIRASRMSFLQMKYPSCMIVKSALDIGQIDSIKEESKSSVLLNILQ